MIAIRREFEEKIKDVNLYFELLHDILEKNAVLSISGSSPKSIDPQLSKVLKANVFLLLYNLLESTIRRCIEQIHININDDLITFDQAIDEVKKIWIEYNYNNFKNHSSEQIFAAIQDMVADTIAVDYEKYISKRKANDISGSIDARKVRALSEKYAFSTNTRIIGQNLVVIKSRRNNLAHGNVTFAECGKDYSYSDLNKFRKETFLFLREFIDKIEHHVLGKKYRV